MAVEAIGAHKLRSFLTLVGIIAGVAAIISIMTGVSVVQSTMEKLAIDVAHVRLEQTVLPPVGQIGIPGIGQSCVPQLLERKDHEMVVQHANTGHARGRERPGRVQAGLPGKHQ